MNKTELKKEIKENIKTGASKSDLFMKYYDNGIIKDKNLAYYIARQQNPDLCSAHKKKNTLIGINSSSISDEFIRY